MTPSSRNRPPIDAWAALCTLAAVVIFGVGFGISAVSNDWTNLAFAGPCALFMLWWGNRTPKALRPGAPQQAQARRTRVSAGMVVTRRGLLPFLVARRRVR